MLRGSTHQLTGPKDESFDQHQADAPARRYFYGNDVVFSGSAGRCSDSHALADAKNLPEIERIAKACADGVMDAMPTERIISGITVTMFCAGYYYVSQGMAGALTPQDLLKALGLSGANDPTDTG